MKPLLLPSSVICVWEHEKGNLSTENEPKMCLSLQNVLTVTVEGVLGLFRYSTQCTMVVFFQILEQRDGNGMNIEEEEKLGLAEEVTVGSHDVSDAVET
ncbi:hypothetical protein DY000_02054447 [Brassica cretica]|uniref:Uncharacterized protein n=1 Tax=Brassica cretica TaxID=69181 RepID=A0ABQ7AGN9_BRACR|nr:hypothetical protein DY000_02054447 [Brassica cretica]